MPKHYSHQLHTKVQEDKKRTKQPTEHDHSGQSSDGNDFNHALPGNARSAQMQWHRIPHACTQVKLFRHSTNTDHERILLPGMQSILPGMQSILHMQYQVDKNKADLTKTCTINTKVTQLCISVPTPSSAFKMFWDSVWHEFSYFFCQQKNLCNVAGAPNT